MKNVGLNGLKATKHAKIRGGYVHVNAMISGVYYRFSTKKIANEKNLAWVERNYLDLIDAYKRGKETQECDMGLDIAKYGRIVLEAHCKDRKQSTYKRYNNVFEKYIVDRIGEMQVASVKPKNAKDIFAKFSDLTHTNKSLVLNLLRLIFKNAVLDEMLNTNPFDYIKNPKNKEASEAHLHKAYNETQMLEILKTPKEYLLSLYLYIAFFTGMRPNEILALKFSDIDLERGFISVSKNISCKEIVKTKNYRSRLIDIIAPLRYFLEKKFIWGKQDDFIFKGRYGKLANEINYARAFKKILLKLDLESNTLYSARHTFASLMLESGEVQKKALESFRQSLDSIKQDSKEAFKSCQLRAALKKAKDSLDNLKKHFSFSHYFKNVLESNLSHSLFNTLFIYSHFCIKKLYDLLSCGNLYHIFNFKIPFISRTCATLPTIMQTRKINITNFF